MNEAVRDAVVAYLAAEEVELDDLSLKGGGKSRILKVVVDAEGGLGVDRIADMSRGLARLLDEDDAITGSYTLEVTSPGLERKLTKPHHFKKSIGREVSVVTKEEIAGENNHKGVLEAVVSGGVVVRIGDDAREIAFEGITRAQTVFRWKAKAKPGGK